jgi:hypothetical protein
MAVVQMAAAQRAVAQRAAAPPVRERNVIHRLHHQAAVTVVVAAVTIKNGHTRIRLQKAGCMPAQAVWPVHQEAVAAAAIHPPTEYVPAVVLPQRSVPDFRRYTLSGLWIAIRWSRLRAKNVFVILTCPQRLCMRLRMPVLNTALLFRH